MGSGWRRAFCNTVPKGSRKEVTSTTPTPPPPPPDSSISTPSLRCKTVVPDEDDDKAALEKEFLQWNWKTTPKSHTRGSRIPAAGSNSSSPRSPFSILKKSLRLSRSSCGVCMRSVKTCQGMAIYTAECAHAFHFPCIALHVRKQDALDCPVCHTTWKDVPLLSIHKPIGQNQDHQAEGQPAGVASRNTPIYSPRCVKLEYLRSYADDEPLISPKLDHISRDRRETKAAGVGLDEVEEFQGFFVNPISSSDYAFASNSRNVEVCLLPEAAVISAGQTHETYAVVLKVRAPPPPPAAAAGSPLDVDAIRRAPIDLVAVLDVSGSMSGEKLQMLKRTMRLVVSSLGSVDRLSIVTFSATPKRLMPLIRMTPQGQRSARRMIDRLDCSYGSSTNEALKEAAKVLEDRRERNPVASIILLSDGEDDGVVANDDGNQPQGSSHTSSTRFSHIEIPVNAPESGGGFSSQPAEEAFSKCVSELLSVVVHDLNIQLRLASGSDPAEIAAVYSCAGQPKVFSSNCIKLGNLYAEEERELLVELRVPISSSPSHHVFSVNCCHRDPATEEAIYSRDHTLLVPRLQSIRTASPAIEQLRYAFISTRAIAESRRLIEYHELRCAMQLLTSARDLLLQSKSESALEHIKGIESELAEAQWSHFYAARENISS